MRAVLTLALAGGLTMTTATAGEMCTWGPGSDAPGASLPTYRPPFTVYDTMAGTLRPRRRAIWRQARDRALALWGLSYHVRETAETGHEWGDDVGTYGFGSIVIPGAITIFRDRSSFPQSMGGFDAATGAGLMIFPMWSNWYTAVGYSALVGVIAHEYGHALGFGHGPRGVMGGGLRPSDAERACAEAYYS